jgi:hypothetical protein
MDRDTRQHGGDRQGVDPQKSRAHGCARIIRIAAPRFFNPSRHTRPAMAL